MPEAVSFFLLCLPSLFSIVDPLGCVPVYLALVGKEARPEQQRIAVRASLTLGLVLLLFGVTGTMIFKFFGITMPAFKIAGGALLFVMAMEMVHAKTGARTTQEERNEASAKEDVGIMPIGIPLLSGPGAIATVVVWSARAHRMDQRAALLLSVVLVAGVSLIVLLFASRLARVLGRTGINVASRIMGLILAATAAQFLIDGWREAFSVVQ
jgi:multiple antibiotic resistance protein